MAVRVTGAALCTALVGAVSAQEADNATPLRVLRVGTGFVPGLKITIETSVAACQTTLHLPLVPTKMPSDSYLASLPLLEYEELFDGAMWALYDTKTEVMADPTAGCRLAVFKSRHVQIEQTCESRLVGSASVAIEYPHLSPPTTRWEEGNARKSACDRKPRPSDIAGLPLEDAGGTACVWSSAIVGKSMGKAGLPIGKNASEKKTFDTCQYARRPQYFFKGVGRPVILKTFDPNMSMTGRYLPQIVGAFAATNLKLSSLSDGPAIPAARFTRAAAAAFLAQPYKLSLGDAP